MIGKLCSLLIQLVLLALVLTSVGVARVYFEQVSWKPMAGEIFPDVPEEPLLQSPLSYERIGLLSCALTGDRNGKLVILLHGFPETGLLSWHKQVDDLVAAGFFVVVPDQRGYNASSKPELVSDYALSHLALDIVHIIDHFGRSKAHIVGHDWGAAVAWYLAGRFPQKVEKLTVLNVPHPAVMEETLRTSWTQLQKSWYMFFFQLPFVPEAKIRKSNFLWLTGAFAAAEAGTFPKYIIEKYHESWSQPGCVEGMLSWYRAMIRGVFTMSNDKIDRISVPTLLIWGDNDFALDTMMAQPSVDMCDDGQLLLVPGISHWVQHEAPDVVNKALVSFLTK